MAKKVTVNKDCCIGCGACVSICGEVFALDDEGKSEVIGEVTSENQQDVEDAISSCPVQAIE